MYNTRSRAGVAVICACLLGSLLLLSGCGLIIINKTGADTTSAPVSDTLPPSPGTSAAPVTTSPPATVTFPDRIGEAESRLDSLFTLDLSTYDLMIVSAAETADVFNPDESDVLYAAYTNRNSMVCEKYGCHLFFTRSNFDTIRNELAAAIKSGEYYGDMLLLPGNSAGAFAASGLLLELKQLPFYSVAGTSTEGAGYYNGHNFFDISDATDDPQGIYVTYFNRALAGKEGTDGLYGAALADGFNLEYMLTAAAEHPATDGGYALTVAGSVNSFDFLGDIMMIRSGYDFVVNNAAGAPQLTYPDGSLAALTETITRIASCGIYRPAGTEGEASSFDVFSGGKSLFRFGTVSEIFSLYDDDVEWGILPLPYAGGSADVCAVTHASRPVICVPANNIRYEPTGIALTALAAASGDWIRDQLCAICIEKYLRDNDSCLTLHKILSQKTFYDFSYLYSTCIVGLSDGSFGAARACVLNGTPLTDSTAKVAEAVNRTLKSYK